MRNIITILLLLISSVAFGQGTVNFGASRPQDTSLSKGQLKLTAYSNSNSTKYLTVNSNGYVVFGVPAGGGSSGDSTVFFTVYRSDTMRIGIYGKIRSDSVLMRGLITSLTNYTDSLYTVLSTKQGADSLLLALQIDTLQSDVVVLDSTVGVLVSEMATAQSDIVLIDSAVGVAFGAISALYDTLPNYVDTAQLNDSLQVVKALINTKQNYSDTTTWDATRYWVSTQIPSLSGYVPYTGATTDVNIGTHNLLTNSVRLSTSPTGTLTNVGQLYFDATNVTPSIPLNANVTLQIGQEEHVRARNNTGVQINDGQVVYINSAQGNNPTIALANADSVNTSEVIGVATENIADNGTGFITTYGTVNGINTSAFNVGDILYLSATNGTITNVIPTPPHNVVKIGVALNDIPNGKIFVKPSQAIGQDTTFAAPYNSNKVAPTQRAIGTYVRKIVKDTASALRTAINTKGSGTVTSIQLVGGTNVTITPTTAITTSGVYTISATGGGGGGSPISATSPSVLYKSGSDTLKGASKVVVDSTDGRLILARNVDTSAVSTPYNGGTKIVGRNLMGMSALAIVDTVSIPAALQRSLNAQITSTLMPNTTVLTGAGATGNYSIGAPISIMPTSSPLVTNVVGSYNSTIQHFNYTKLVITTQTSPNIPAGIRTNSNIIPLGIICGNTKFGGGGGRGTFTFSFPTYNSGQRIFVGYSVLFSQQNTDPTNFLQANSGLGVGKDATDTELQFFHSNNLSVTPTKVSTGITPNAEDVYRVTVYVAPNSAYYIQLEVLNKNRITVRTFNPTTNVPAVSTKLYPMQWINNATTGAAIQYGFIYAMEEIY
jgi:hypothetical protein